MAKPKTKIDQTRRMPKAGEANKLVCSYTMDRISLQHLDSLMVLMHDKNKSRIICMLIDQQYFRLMEECG